MNKNKYFENISIFIYDVLFVFESSVIICFCLHRYGKLKMPNRRSIVKDYHLKSYVLVLSIINK